MVLNAIKYSKRLKRLTELGKKLQSLKRTKNIKLKLWTLNPVFLI